MLYCDSIGGAAAPNTRTPDGKSRLYKPQPRLHLIANPIHESTINQWIKRMLFVILQLRQLHKLDSLSRLWGTGGLLFILQQGEPLQLGGKPRLRAAMKRFLPKFKSGRPNSTSKNAASRGHKVDKVTNDRRDDARKINKGVPATPIPQVLFKWPENPPKDTTSSQKMTSVLESVPEGSQIKLTEESLGMTSNISASPHTNAVVRRLGAYSDEPMTAVMGVSSRSSNYGDVPSRLPTFSPGYSPIS